MSDYESHKGILRPTELTTQDIVKEYLLNYDGSNKWILNDRKKVLEGETLDEDILEQYLYDIDGYVKVNNKIYEMEDKPFVDDADIFEMSENPDGSLEYLVRFYNGGCGLFEALDTAYDRNINK
jgi:hypothetical protein